MGLSVEELCVAREVCKKNIENLLFDFAEWQSELSGIESQMQILQTVN
jgi:hypothetical protein